MALVGLDSLYVAKITTDASGKETYGTPKRIKKVMEAKITPSIDSQNINADDTVAEIINAFSSVDVEFTISDLGSGDYELLLGKEKDENGVIIDKASDDAPYFAMGFRSKKSNSNHYRHIWLYKGKFQPIEESFATQTDKADSQSQPIKGTFVKRDDGKWRAKVDSDDPNVTPAVISGWFTSVYESPTTVTP